jgi:putative oxidoreductase
MLNRPLPAPARDIALLIGRVLLGVVLFAHGWQKLMINGIAGTYGQFEKLGIPLAIVSASFTSFVEFVGGALLIIGALTTTVIALDLVVMVGAAGFVHVTHGVFAQNGGWELVGVIVAAELALAAAGPGRFSVDHLISSRRAREEAPPRPARPTAPNGSFTSTTAHETRAPQRTGVASQFTRLSPLDTGPIAIDTQRARLTPQTAPQPTVAQQTALAKAVARPDDATRTERLMQVPPAARPATVADLVGATGPCPQVQTPAAGSPSVGSPSVGSRSVGSPSGGSVPVASLSGESLFGQALLSGYDPVAPAAPAEAKIPDEPREPVVAAPLFEPRLPMIDAQPAFGPRRAFDAPRPLATQVPFVAYAPFVDQAPAAVQRPGELPQRVRRAERVGQVGAAPSVTAR